MSEAVKAALDKRWRGAYWRHFEERDQQREIREMTEILRAADAARAVPDEDVVRAILITCGLGQKAAEVAVQALRAAGFTVIHTEARYG